jgi:hypothetical protein
MVLILLFSEISGGSYFSEKRSMSKALLPLMNIQRKKSLESLIWLFRTALKKEEKSHFGR